MNTPEESTIIHNYFSTLGKKGGAKTGSTKSRGDHNYYVNLGKHSEEMRQERRKGEHHEDY